AAVTTRPREGDWIRASLRFSALNDVDAEVRSLLTPAAVGGDNDEPARRWLREQLRDPSWVVRAAATRALRLRGERRLLARLVAADPAVRRAAAGALAACAPKLDLSWRAAAAQALAPRGAETSAARAALEALTARGLPGPALLALAGSPLAWMRALALRAH